MSTLLHVPGSAIRDIEPSAVKPMRFSNFARLLSTLAGKPATFGVAVLAQNTQNRDTAAMQIKLDELIRATQGAHNAILDLEHLDEPQLEAYLKRYEHLAAAAREKLRTGRIDTDSPEIKHPG